MATAQQTEHEIQDKILADPNVQWYVLVRGFRAAYPEFSAEVHEDLAYRMQKIIQKD